MKAPKVNQIKAGTEQFIITVTGNAGNVTEYFQSYQTVIAMRTAGQVTLDRDSWDYSRTTGKYRNLFLGEDKKATEAKIKSGEYLLADLNG